MNELSLVITTIDQKDLAKKLINSIIKQKLAVCALISSETSIYFWQNKIEESPEYLIKFKTLENKLPQLKAAIQAEHPYETCLIAEIKTTDCNAEYLDYASSYLN